MRALACAVALTTVFVAETSAYADHVGARPNQQHDVISWTEADSSVQFAASATAFDIEDQSGSFWTASAATELFLRQWDLRLEVPVHSLEVDNQRDTGIGDIVVGGSRRLSRGDLTIALGGDFYAPTGDMDTGLGQGAAVAPRARVVYSLPSSLRVFGDTALVIGLEDTPADAMIVEPRGELELRTTAGLAWSRSRFAVSLAAQVSTVLVADSGAGHSFIIATPAAGVTVSDGLWLTLFAEAPVQHDRRFDWRMGLAAKYQWEKAHDDGGSRHHHEH
jgi:hypothetical protein